MKPASTGLLAALFAVACSLGALAAPARGYTSRRRVRPPAGKFRSVRPRAKFRSFITITTFTPNPTSSNRGAFWRHW